VQLRPCDQQRSREGSDNASTLHVQFAARIAGVSEKRVVLRNLASTNTQRVRDPPTARSNNHTTNHQQCPYALSPQPQGVPHSGRNFLIALVSPLGSTML
jgi:hypothetical protein